ncbi:MAG: DUF4139 domain-containing protein [Thermodesulfobacteriota bacterium]
MIARFVLALLFLAVLCFQAEAGSVTVSGAPDQTAVEVTAYNNNLALVKDVRNVKLPKGEGELQFMDVASQIMPVTVHVKSLSDPAAFTVLEQNYEYDLMNPNKLMDKYVGKQIKIVDENKFLDRKEILDATLLSNNQGQPVFRIKDEIWLGHGGYRVLPKLPEDLIAKPTLTWLVSNQTDKPHTLEVSYLTNQINWKADYVVILDKEDKQADLSGWVTVDNKSGAAYHNARLKLVAGEVHTVQPPVPASVAVPRRMKAELEARPQLEEKAFFEYHIYDLQRKTTIKDNQTKQIRFTEASGVKVDKELLVYGVKTYFARQYREENPKQPVNVYVKLKNSKENRMGMPLPAGIMRLYKQDQDGSQQFVGEDKIVHTPKNEEVKLKIGEAFDVVAERRQTDFKQITTRLWESEWEITLRNRKDADVTVGIVEPLIGNWEVISKSHPFEKKDAFTIRFDVKVPKDKELKVKYRIRVGLP